MLVNRHDFIAAQYGQFYEKDINKTLLKFAISNSNEIFLKYAFKNGLFDGYITKDDPDMIEYLL